jgi:hypothetical protein
MVEADRFHFCTSEFDVDGSPTAVPSNFGFAICILTYSASNFFWARLRTIRYKAKAPITTTPAMVIAPSSQVGRRAGNAASAKATKTKKTALMFSSGFRTKLRFVCLQNCPFCAPRRSIKDAAPKHAISLKRVTKSKASPHNGILSCFFHGFSSALFRNFRSPKAIRRRVECG